MLDAQNKPHGIQGFINLFWIGTTIYACLSVYSQYQATGRLDFPLRVLQESYRKYHEFLFCDAFLLLYTYTAPLFQILVAWGCIGPNSGWAAVVRCTLPVVLVAWALHVSVRRDWPPVQIGTFLAHSYVLGMKMHSYLVSNREFEVTHRRRLGRKRSVVHPAASTEPLHKSPENIYPQNVTFANFTLFLLIPTLVYEPEYPRTASVRPAYLADRTLGMVCILVLLSIIVQHYIYPVLTMRPQLPFLGALASLLLPVTVSYLLLFFLVFEYVLNWFAEITRFADRHFYSDWWNSLTYAEFAKKWNIPVHRFFQRHIYFESINSYKISRWNAAFLTFLISSVLHEIVMSVVGRRFNGKFFLFQMSQVPLNWLASQVALHRYPLLANVLFWLSMVIGLPLIAILYSCKF